MFECNIQSELTGIGGVTLYMNSICFPLKQHDSQESYRNKMAKAKGAKRNGSESVFGKQTQLVKLNNLT